MTVAALDDVPADLQGSPEYRRRVGAAMVSRALASAVREASTSEEVTINA
jgi:carbon-monoxide dehydrogenase medium subunit